MPTRSKLSWILVALAVMIGAAAFACGGDGGEEPKATATKEVGETPEDRTPTTTGEIITPEDVLRKDGTATKTAEIEWGFMFELSGTLAAFGQPTGDGVKLAVQEINEAGGFQVDDTVYTIKLVERDTRSEIPQAVAVATEFVRDRGLKVIWGPATTGEPEATQITQPQQVLHFCPCEGRELTALSSVDKAEGDSHWAFQTLPPITALFKEGPADLKRDFPEFETFAIVCSNDDSGRRVCPTLVSAYEGAGFTASIDPDETQVDPRTTDYLSVLTKIRQTDPDILLNFVDPFNEGTFLKQALELGVGRYFAAVKVPPDLWDVAVGDPKIHETYAGWGGFPRQQLEPTSEEARVYFEKYKDFVGGNLPLVPFVSLLTYDATYMLVAAMQQAGTVDDTTAIADALEQLHYDGVGEDDIYFNKRHIIVEGGDGCTVYQREITCEHGEPPEEIKD